MKSKLWIVICLLIAGCRSTSLSICKNDMPKEILIYSYELNSEMRITPTIDQVVNSAPFRDTISDQVSVEYIVSVFKGLSTKKTDTKNFNLRSVCVFVYRDSSVEILEIDTYGQIRNKDIVAAGSYRLINLLGINCLSFESRH